MTVRLTLRLPKGVYQRIVDESQKSRRSLNAVIVDSLQRTELACAPERKLTPTEVWQRLVDQSNAGWDAETDAAWDAAFGLVGGEPELSDDAYWKLMPPIDPQNRGSRSIIEDREDRF